MKYITSLLVLVALLVGVGFLAGVFEVSPTPVAPEEEAIEESSHAMQYATLATNRGTIVLELFTDLAPKTVDNFTSLAGDNFYNGTRFHRVISGFMIQGGDPLSADPDQSDFWGTGGPGYTFEDEIHAENNNAIGTIAMANAGPNTNGSQFFINVADNSFLDDKHTVFGRVIEGMDIVMAISNTETNPMDRPVDDIVLESVTISADRPDVSL